MNLSHYTRKKIPARVACQECGHVSEVAKLKSATRPAPLPDVLEVGVVCPNCNHFYHAAYTDDHLMRLQRDAQLTRLPAEREKLLRRYRRKFEAYQVEISDRLAGQATDDASEGTGHENT